MAKSGKTQSVLVRVLGLLGLSAAVTRQRRLVGLDLSTRRVRAVEFTADTEGIVLTRFVNKELDPKMSRAEALAAVVNAEGLRDAPVASAVNGQAVIVRYFLLPEMADERLAEAVQQEAPKYIPFDLAEVMLDYQRLGRRESPNGNGAPEVRVVLVGAKKDFIYEHLQMVQEAGLNARAIDVDCFAIANAFEHYCNRHPEAMELMKSAASVALLDVGEDKTAINILEKGTLGFTREVYIAQGEFVRECTRRLSVEVPMAEQLLREPGENLEKVVASVTRVTEELVREARLSFDYFEHQTDLPVEQVYLSGVASQYPMLRETLEEKLARPTMLWNAVDGLAVDAERVDVAALQACGAELAVAVGLAARVLQ